MWCVSHLGWLPIFFVLWMSCASTGPTGNVPIDRTNHRYSSRLDWQWRWSFPLPHGNSLHAVWVAPNDDAWAAGSNGAVVRFHGQTETIMRVDTRESLRAIWGLSNSDIWTVGTRGTASHWDGNSWLLVPVPVNDDLVAIWGSNRDQVWAVGGTRLGNAKYVNGGGTILRWDGKSWTVVARDADNPFKAIWGSSAANVVVGGHGPLWHFDGSTWSSFSLGTLSVQAIWGTGPDDVWAVGRDRLMANHAGIRVAVGRDPGTN